MKLNFSSVFPLIALAISSLLFGVGCDVGVIDSGVADAGVADVGVTDSGVTDSGVTDAGVTVSGVTDSGVTDAGVTDSGVADAGNGYCIDGGGELAGFEFPGYEIVELQVSDEVQDQTFSSFSLWSISDPCPQFGARIDEIAGGVVSPLSGFESGRMFYTGVLKRQEEWGVNLFGEEFIGVFSVDLETGEVVSCQRLDDPPAGIGERTLGRIIADPLSGNIFITGTDGWPGDLGSHARYPCNSCIEKTYSVLWKYDGSLLNQSSRRERLGSLFAVTQNDIVLRSQGRGIIVPYGISLLYYTAAGVFEKETRIDYEFFGQCANIYITRMRMHDDEKFYLSLRGLGQDALEVTHVFIGEISSGFGIGTYDQFPGYSLNVAGELHNLTVAPVSIDEVLMTSSSLRYCASTTTTILCVDVDGRDGSIEIASGISGLERRSIRPFFEVGFSDEYSVALRPNLFIVVRESSGEVDMAVIDRESMSVNIVAVPEIDGLTTSYPVEGGILLVGQSSISMIELDGVDTSLGGGFPRGFSLGGNTNSGFVKTSQ